MRRPIGSLKSFLKINMCLLQIFFHMVQNVQFHADIQREQSYQFFYCFSSFTVCILRSIFYQTVSPHSYKPFTTVLNVFTLNMVSCFRLFYKPFFNHNSYCLICTPTPCHPLSSGCVARALGEPGVEKNKYRRVFSFFSPKADETKRYYFLSMWYHFDSENRVCCK